jgi:hypothetical protein
MRKEYAATSFLNHGRDSRRTLIRRELYMKRTLILALSFAVMTLPSVQQLQAAPHAIYSPASSTTDKGHKVQMTLHNASTGPMEFKVGEDVVALDAGKAIALKVPVGTRIVTNKANGTHQAGELIAEVTKELNGATIHIK